MATITVAGLDLPDPVEPRLNHDVPTSIFRLRADQIGKRPTQVNVVSELRNGINKRRRYHQRGITIQTTFTITEDLDQLIHDLALDRNVSRSSVVRQALCFYFTSLAEQKEKATRQKK